ncbi:protein snakeskin-like [Cylas formicarius]|uniref:protein snakeskin-like n=1 Tax=Cylas formicarius TaxID=197179 RepID=UPI00295839C2|nr:protein snakeskin-like [Cylas formicarius]
MSVSRLSIIKFLELLIAVICVGLHYKSQTGDLNVDMLSVVAFGGFIIILVGGFAGYLMSTPINKRIDIFFSLVGCAMFIAAGALNIKHYENYSRSEYRDYGLSKGSMAVINGALFLLDSLLTWRGDF